jgi:hypothetical protein
MSLLMSILNYVFMPPQLLSACREVLQSRQQLRKHNHSTNVTSSPSLRATRASKTIQMLGRAIAQVFSRRVPTAVAQVRARFRSCGICGGQSGTGTGFLQVLRPLLLIFVPPIAPQSLSSSIILGCYNRPIVAAVPSGFSHTPLTDSLTHSLTHSLLELSPS